jgi:hypothetical protein
MESSCSDNSPEMNEIKKSYTNIYERITAFASYLGEEDIDIRITSELFAESIEIL